LLICGGVYAVRGAYEQEHQLHSYDFKTIYGSARCLIQGCDPYDSQQIYTAFVKAGGPGDDLRPFRAHEPVYLPSALAIVAPFALLPWGPAHVLWLALSASAFLLGVALIARLCLPISPMLSALAIGFLLLSNTMLMRLAQPVQLTAGLCAIAVWCLLEGRYLRTGVLCFAFALVFKPHVTGFVWLYFLISGGDYRKHALRILIAAFLISLPGFAWASAMPASSHWMRELPANLNALSAPGMTNDPGPLNRDVHYLTQIQAVISVFLNDPGVYNRMAHAMGAVLMGLWLAPVLLMRPSKERDYLALASIACISLLPMYHRSYDACILLLIFPAFAVLTSRGTRLRGLTLLFTFVPLVLLRQVWDDFANHHLVPIFATAGPLRPWQIVLLQRPVPVGCSLLAIFYLASFYAAMQRERKALRAPTEPGGDVPAQASIFAEAVGEVPASRRTLPTQIAVRT
jgi:hypothetical protein